MKSVSRHPDIPSVDFLYIFAAFVGSLVICQVLASKIVALQIPLLGNLIFPAGVVAYAITYLCTDVIEEVWGRKWASRVVLAGFAANVIVLLLIQIARALPAAPFWDNGTGWSNTLTSTSRITLASLIAYFASQYHDLWMFQLIRRHTNGRFLWLRNIVSTFLSQTIDTILFITIAFIGVAPVWQMIVGQLIIKWFLALIDTPFVYLLVSLVGKSTKHNNASILR